MLWLAAAVPGQGNPSSPTPTPTASPEQRPAGYFLCVKTFPPGASVYLEAASDQGNLLLLGQADEPIWIDAKKPSTTRIHLGGPLQERKVSAHWGYGEVMQTVTLWPAQGRLIQRSFRTGVAEGVERQVYELPDEDGAVIALRPLPGLTNRLKRWGYFALSHWVLSGLFLAGAVAAGFAYVHYKPILEERRWRSRRERELHERFANLDPDEDRFLNRKFKKWRTVERLGAGGMAVVYRAIPMDTLSDDDSVALKVMNAELNRDPEYRRRFQREIEISRSLDHPNVVRPIDWDEQSGVLFLVMEYVDGKPLRDVIPKGGFAIARALELAIQIASGLIYAHKKGIVHRDLKPENIMLTKRNLIKVMDLGLAKRNESDNVTKTGDTFGTPAYMAPEQIAGGGTLLPATDQYAFGIILFELLLGKRPFVADDTLTLVLKHLNEAPPRVRTVAPQLPQDLDDAVDRMLAKDPSKRFPSMTEVKTKLEQIRKKYE